MNEAKVALIIDTLKGRVGTDFQLDLNNILYEYWQFHGKKFISISWFGGDEKNDGWVPDLACFYQAYSPRYLSGSFKIDMRTKFCEDLEGLAENVLNKNEWNGRLDLFIFIVNDKGLALPEDSLSFYDFEVQKVNAKYGSHITYRIYTINELNDLLFEIKDTNFIDRLISKLRLNQNLEAATATSSDILYFLNIVEENIGNAYMAAIPIDYKKISTNHKMEINGIKKHSAAIEEKMSKLSVVDAAFREINSDTKTRTKFETVRNYFVTEYFRLEQTYKGDALYEEMLRVTHDISNNYPAFLLSGELTLIYIFDRCDIFEKEVE